MASYNLLRLSLLNQDTMGAEKWITDVYRACSGMQWTGSCSLCNLMGSMVRTEKKRYLVFTGEL